NDHTLGRGLTGCRRRRGQQLHQAKQRHRCRPRDSQLYANAHLVPPMVVGRPLESQPRQPITSPRTSPRTIVAWFAESRQMFVVASGRYSTTGDRPSSRPRASCATTQNVGPLLLTTIAVSKPVQACAPTGDSDERSRPANTVQRATSVAPFQQAYTAKPPAGSGWATIRGPSAGRPTQS